MKAYNSICASAHNCEGSVGGNNLNKSTRGNSLWWIVVIFSIVFCTAVTAAVIPELAMSNWYAHCYWQKPFIGNGCRKRYKTFYEVLQLHEVFYSLQVKNLSLFTVPFNFNTWRLESVVFFQQLICFMVCDSKWSVNVYFPLTPTICYTI